MANASGAHLTEFGIVVAQGVNKLLEAVTEKKGAIEAKALRFRGGMKT